MSTTSCRSQADMGHLTESSRFLAYEEEACRQALAKLAASKYKQADSINLVFCCGFLQLCPKKTHAACLCSFDDLYTHNPDHTFEALSTEGIMHRSRRRVFLFISRPKSNGDAVQRASEIDLLSWMTKLGFASRPTPATTALQLSSFKFQHTTSLNTLNNRHLDRKTPFALQSMRQHSLN